MSSTGPAGGPGKHSRHAPCSQVSCTRLGISDSQQSARLVCAPRCWEDIPDRLVESEGGERSHMVNWGRGIQVKTEQARRWEGSGAMAHQQESHGGGGQRGGGPPRPWIHAHSIQWGQWLKYTGTFFQWGLLRQLRKMAYVFEEL